MDALILTCGTGGGHNSACAAVQQELTSRGHRVQTLNPYLLKGEKVADLVNNAYIMLAQKAPSAFGVVYEIGNAYRYLPVRSPVYHVNRLMAPVLQRWIDERHFDVIASTHLFPAEILTNMKRCGGSLPPTVYIATDYTCIPFTEETECDAYVIPCAQLTDEFAQRGIPAQKLYPLGIPVSEAYAEPLAKEEARRLLGIDPEKLVILLAGGSIGAGQIEQIIPLILGHYGESAQLIVVCGNNKALYRRLERAYADKCQLLEFTSQMAVYMRACDLFLSKPGGLSSTEAAVGGTALIHLAPIPGCETRNRDFFAVHGMAYSASSPKKNLCSACDMLLDPANRKTMRENQRRIIPPHAAKSIADIMESSASNALAGVLRTSLPSLGTVSEVRE